VKANPPLVKLPKLASLVALLLPSANPTGTQEEKVQASINIKLTFLCLKQPETIKYFM
jgi:hypothetical protein